MALPLSYNWRNLFVRKTTTVLTVLVVAAVVGVFAWMVGFWGALRHSLAFASDPRKLIVLKPGATSESNSAISADEYNRLVQLSEMAVDPATGLPLESPEMLVQVYLTRRGDNGRTNANVAVRGVTDAAFKVHANVKLLGRGFTAGGYEVIVGRAAAKQFSGLDVDGTLNLGYSGNRKFRIVGYFSADGGPMESEIWGRLPDIKGAYQRDAYSSASIRLNPGADPRAVIKRIAGPAIQLSAQTEAAYWEGQAKYVHLYLYLVTALVGIMCLAAAFSIANTMYASVAGRTREFAMLRTIGFSGRQVLVSVLVESVFLALLGGVLGCLGCWTWLRLTGSMKDMFGASTFTTIAFDIVVTPRIVACAISQVCVVAVLGAFLPALRAARLEVVQALREA
jgi:putative ABC transport system permease protein